MQLKAIFKNLAKEKHISAQLVMQNFMLERLLERISVSNILLTDEEGDGCGGYYID